MRNTGWDYRVEDSAKSGVIRWSFVIIILVIVVGLAPRVGGLFIKFAIIPGGALILPCTKRFTVNPGVTMSPHSLPPRPPSVPSPHSMLNNRAPSFRVCPPPAVSTLAEQALAIRLWLDAIRIRVTVSPRINPAARLLTETLVYARL